MAISPAEATLALARQHALASSTQAERLAAGLARAFVAVEGLDDVAMSRWLAVAAPTAQSAEAAAWQLGQAYMRLLTQVHGARLGPVPVPTLGTLGDYRLTWQGAMIAARAHAGDGYEAAKVAGSARARELAATGYSSANRQGATDTMRAAGVEHYRRVPVGVTCKFCLTIATRRYFVGELAPAHGSCDCGVMPVFAGEDVDRVVGAAASRALAALAA